MKSVVVLISGSGTNLQAIIDAITSQQLPDTAISLVVSNRAAAFGLTRALTAGIPTFYFPLKPYTDQGLSREQYDADLAQRVKEELGGKEPDLVVLAGWMHILSSHFIQKFPCGLINLHPALPGQFDGAHAIQRAYEAFVAGQCDHTGVMVHWVIPEVDRGEVILSRRVEIVKGDTQEMLEERIHLVEHGLLVEAIHKVLKL